MSWLRKLDLFPAKIHSILPVLGLLARKITLFLSGEKMADFDVS